MSCDDCVCHACGDGIIEPTQCTECDLWFDLDTMDVINGELYCDTCHYFKIEEFMTYEDCVASFEEVCPPESFMTYNRHDSIAQREAFNNYTDALCKDGRITEELYDSMDNPY